MKKLFLLLSIALMSAVAVSCKDKDKDAVETLAGTSWEASKSMSIAGASISIISLLEFPTVSDFGLELIIKTTGFPDDRESFSGNYVYDTKSGQVTFTVDNESIIGSVDKKNNTLTVDFEGYQLVFIKVK